METKRRWRKPVVISLAVQCLLLAGLGWFATALLNPPELAEPLLELSLIDDAGPALDTAVQASGAAQAASLPATASKMEDHTAAAVSASGSLPVIQTEIGNRGETSGGDAGERTASQPAGGGSDRNAADGKGSADGRRGGIAPPGILEAVEPVYPDKARRNGWEGLVVLIVRIQPDGLAGNISVSQSSGYDSLDQAAVEAVQKWRFIPAKERESGQAITAYTRIPVVFKLR